MKNNEKKKVCKSMFEKLRDFDMETFNDMLETV